MASGFDISASINKMIELRFQTPQDKSEALARIHLLLDISISLAEKRGAQGTELAARNDVIKQELAEARSVLADVQQRREAGTAAAYEVQEAQADVDDLVQELAANRQLIASIRTFHSDVIKQADDIIKSAA